MNHWWIWSSADRVVPILVFLAAITVIAELADSAGVFEVGAEVAARSGSGSIRRLWLVVVFLASLTTVFLSLDTTAILLTPVVLSLAKRLGIAPWPFALATVWLANTASLVLPVSNLTNLLLVNKLGWSVTRYATRMWFPALVAITVTVVVLGFLVRSSLSGSYPSSSSAIERDPILFRCALTVCLLVGPLFFIGVPPWMVGLFGAVLLVAVFSWRSRSSLAWSLLPWRLVLATSAMFLVVGFLQQIGLDHVLGRFVGQGNGLGALLRLAASGAVGSNAINNLPAYIALEPLAANSPDRMLALLVGTNLGPLITLWGSLATLLWRDRCRAAGVAVSARMFALSGLLGAPLLLVTTTTAIWATR